MKLLQRHTYLLALLLFAFFARIFYLFDNVIPFSFDHGKDSLAIMDMVVNLSPKFIGPWTSIPGLYFGPAWYYLLAPFYLLFGFNPVGGAFAMILLVLLQIYLAYKYLGKYEALIISAAPLWFTFSKSAWNPFPMSLVTLVLLILLKQSIQKKALTLKTSFGLGMTASFGFHFSAAFAIFYPIIVLASLLIFRVKMTFKNTVLAGLGFSLPFLPQILFEFRYNFSQVRAIFRYFQEGEDHAFGLEKILSVMQISMGELRLGLLPETNYLGVLSTAITLALLAGLVAVFMRHQHSQKELRHNFILAALFILIPLFGFFFLHFNVWYVYAMIPAAVLLGGSLLRFSPRWFRWLYIVLLILGPLFNYYSYFSFDKANLEQSRGFLPVKLEAVQRIQEMAAGRSYASYHYVPDVYDFSYQYIYYWRAQQGHTLPVEFSYKPGETSYLVQKADLQQRFPSPTETVEVVFFVVEKPEHTQFLDQWWSEQRYSAIQETIELSPEVTLYVATP